MQSVPRPQTAHSISHWPIVISTWARLKKPSKTHKKANPCSSPPLNDAFSILPLLRSGHPLRANFARAFLGGRVLPLASFFLDLPETLHFSIGDYSKKC